MDELFSYSLGNPVYTVWMSGIQEIISGMRSSTKGDLTAMNHGLDGRVFQSTSDLATDDLVLVEDAVVDYVNSGVSPATLTTASFDWYDRIIFGVYRGFAGGNQIAGGSGDYFFDAAGAPTLFLGYTGRGAKDAGNNNVTAGNWPVPAAGTSWAITITTNVFLYVDPADNKLYLYNNTGSTIRTPFLAFFATANTGKRP